MGKHERQQVHKDRVARRKAQEIIAQQRVAEMQRRKTEYEAVFRQVYEDQRELPINIPFGQAWFLVTRLQLASRHPNLSDFQRNQIIELGKQFQSGIARDYPAADSILEMGWDSYFDAAVV